jgi:hypothetical protein
MRLGALQPGYLPWLGFFDQIDRSDVFILYDDLPYAKDSWRNRNRVRTSQGWCWLTVPVVNAGRSGKTIREIEISDDRDWRRDHWRTIRNHYARTRYFTHHEEFFGRLYEKPWRYIVDLDLEVIFYLVGVLGLRTRMLLSSEEGLEREHLRTREGGKDPAGRIVFLCRRLGADCFLEGALGRSFIEPGRCEQFAITLEFHDYQHPRYRQLFRPFIPYLSIIDLVFNHGPESLDILTGRKVLPDLTRTTPRASDGA